jgi:exopolysaccharide biosynthesis protein
MLGIERFGLAEFLATEQMKQRFELSDEQVTSIRQTSKTRTAQAANQKLDLTRKANEALINELSNVDRTRFDELVGNRILDEFLQTQLFQSPE